MSTKNETFSRRTALLRLSGLAVGAYAAPSLTALSMARASEGSGNSGASGNSGPSDKSGPSGDSGPSEDSGASENSGPSDESGPSEESRPSIPSGVDTAQECTGAGGKWDPSESSCS